MNSNIISAISETFEHVLFALNITPNPNVVKEFSKVSRLKQYQFSPLKQYHICQVPEESVTNSQIPY